MIKKESIKIASEMKNLSKVRQFIDRVTNGSNFSPEQIFDIKVAASEAVSNAIEHGSPNGTKNKVLVETEYNNDFLKLEVSDEGTFKPRMPVDDPTFPHHRGRGVTFMLALMDEVNISEGKTGTTVKLIKRVKPEI